MRPCKTSDALPPLSSSQQVAEEHSRTNQSVLVRGVKDDDDFKGDVGNNYINTILLLLEILSYLGKLLTSIVLVNKL